MITLVYCFNVAEKKLYYLKSLPNFNSAKYYCGYIHQLLKLLGELNNYIVFPLECINDDFTVRYPVPTKTIYFEIKYQVKYDGNNIYCKIIHCKNIFDDNTQADWVIVPKMTIDDGFPIPTQNQNATNIDQESAPSNPSEKSNGSNKSVDKKNNIICTNNIQFPNLNNIKIV